MSKKVLKCILSLSALCVLSLSACPSQVHADETPFGYIYTADSIPKGTWEFEQWNTVRTGKAGGSYTSLDLKSEFEHGFTDQFLASLYINSSYLYTKDVPDAGDPVQNLENRNEFQVNGVSLELKYQVLSPYKDAMGLAVYMEPELGVRNPRTGDDTIERAIEFKAILQKNFLEDR